MYKNKEIDGVLATRYIASWIIAGGQLHHYYDVCDFKKWLESLGLSEDDVDHVLFLATTGKKELEDNVRTYMYDKSVNERA